jgi:hypothetical protein
MQMLSAIPALPVPDVQRSIPFYRKEWPCTYYQLSPVQIATLQRWKRCRQMRVSSSIDARTVKFSSGLSVRIAVCFARMAIASARQCSRKSVRARQR